jgi:hypothetical protein
MAGRIKQHNNITVLRISLEQRIRDIPFSIPTSQGSSNTELSIVFDLEYQGETYHLFELSPAKIGLVSFDYARVRGYSDEQFSLPLIVNQINPALLSIRKAHKSGNTDAPLWLEIANSASILAIMPWEALLQAGLRVPLLRLPYFSLNPTVPGRNRNIVVCVSVPEAKPSFEVENFLQMLVLQIATPANQSTRLHIFTDQQIYNRYKGVVDNNMSIVLHDPVDAVWYGVAERRISLLDKPGNPESPWLRWILNTIGDESIDIVHFFCHGYLSMGQGALAFAESPLSNDDSGWARFVGPQQLTAFLNQIGAWAIGFSSPPNNFSSTGLRLLTDQVARLRPVTAFLHDARRDSQFSALSSIYGFLSGNKNLQTRFQLEVALRAISLYYSPSQIGWDQVKPDFAASNMLHDFTLLKGKSFELLQERGHVPLWMAACQRDLEQSVADLFEQRQVKETETQAATRQGIEDARMAITNIIERYMPPIDPGNKSK